MYDLKLVPFIPLKARSLPPHEGDGLQAVRHPCKTNAALAAEGRFAGKNSLTGSSRDKMKGAFH
jgi:hypothetical protein